MITLTTFAGFFCYVALLYYLLRGHLRNYVVLFADVVVLLLTLVIDSASYFGPSESGFRFKGITLYYIDDLIRQAMVYILVISLVYKALTNQPERRWIGRWLIAGAAFLVVLFFALAYAGNPTFRWMMTNAVRNLSVTAMGMNLILWVLLVGSRTSDRRLLLVTSGLGLQLAGEAIGQSLRLMTHGLVPVGNFFLIFSHLFCLWIWILAFRKPAPEWKGHS